MSPAKDSLVLLCLPRRGPSDARRKRIVSSREKRFDAGRRSRPTTPSESRLYPCYQCNPWLASFRREGVDDVCQRRQAPFSV
jgi:hypothetical protein